MRWMNLELIIQSEVSQKEKDKFHILMYIYHNFFIHSSVNGHLSCFHVLAVVKSAATSDRIHVSFSVLVSSGCMPRNGIAGSYGGFIPGF